mmetsp:Transcript_10199/g.29952  ORF Transcript_10199/g.29952 Transcript_10199/m.29952 type:complete len:126 (-) Transcript_10199:116-493(-)|eukprot:CAMPEP_0172360638 /NCGR_PEP_ID=MMETSP1060-20121228/4624_1 /TAXON_ID=37318 /ORGANISM="Pseudo-nitzschia pungens, Strain cf. cingulata" /LENGTH=125 /DNA_ID=CAMNT_0013082679 /DNA_START=115 /DNA_END=492 /DNA_ORIENTATION=+
MASTRAKSLIPLLRRSVTTSRTSTKAMRGGMSPPMPPIARIPAPTENLVENHDCLFDDACAPELALDFDSQNVSTAEGLLSWGLAIGAYITLFNVIKHVGQPEVENPAVSRAESDDICIPVEHHE